MTAMLCPAQLRDQAILNLKSCATCFDCLLLEITHGHLQCHLDRQVRSASSTLSIPSNVI